MEGLRETPMKNQRLITKAVPSVLDPLTDEQVVEMAELLRLLSEPTRLRVLLACLSQPASVGEIAMRANLPRGLRQSSFAPAARGTLLTQHTQRQADHLRTMR